MPLTTEQQRDLGNKLARLQGHVQAMDRATRDALDADQRWRRAHRQHAELRAQIAAQYGPAAAPPRPVIRPDDNVLDAYEQTDVTARHTEPSSQER